MNVLQALSEAEEVTVSSGIKTTDAADLDIVDDYNPFVDASQPNDGK